MNNPIIDIEHLSHEFGAQKALDDVNLKIPKGSIFGFLGPNGAGKTTTLRLLLGLLKKQRGHISVFGNDIEKSRIAILKKIGSLIEQPSLYLHLTATENLELFRLSYGSDKKRIAEVLETVGLARTGKKKARAFSLGMKQRLAIAIALQHDPELLILDEPTNGLDPNGIAETRDLIIKLNKEHGKTIIVSSHLLTEIEKMATHAAIMHKGKILFHGELADLHRMQLLSPFIEIRVNDIEKALRVLNGHSVQKVGDSIRVRFKTNQQTAEINELLIRANVRVHQICPGQNDLENLFIQITSA